MDNNVNTELIRGHVDTIILRVLQQSDRYGYEILDIIAEASEGRYSIKQPTLYSCLKRLEKQGFISSYFGDESNGGRRRYYTLTEKGTKTLELDQQEWVFSRSILDRLLSDKQIDLKTIKAPFDANELKPLTKRVKAYDEKPYIAPTQPIIIPITVEAKTIQQPQELTKTIQIPNAFAATPLQPIKQEEKKENIASAQLKANEAQAKADTIVNIKDIQLEEQRLAAAKLLQIGEFAPPAKTLIEQQITSKTAPKDKTEDNKTTDINKEPTEGLNTYYKSENNYKDILGSLFQKQATPLAAETAVAIPFVQTDIIKTEDHPTRSRQFYDLKQSVESEGYKLKSYSKANAASQYYMNYVFGNRIIRDTALLLYLTVIIELIIIYIGRRIFSYGLNVLIPIGLAATIIPILGTIIWALNPIKRVKAKFNFSSALINSIIAYILIVALCTIIYLVSPSIDISFNDGRMYIPFILAINLPIFVLIYNFLYKSKHYHLK